MQLCHNERNLLGYIWNLNDSQIFFQNLQSKNYWWKNTLSLSKVLICDDIETLPKESTWSFKMTSIFVNNIKNQFMDVSTISHHPQNAWKKSSVKGQHRWKNLITIISSWKHVHFSKNSFFFGKLLYIARFFQSQPQENCPKFLVTLQAKGVQWY